MTKLQSTSLTDFDSYSVITVVYSVITKVYSVIMTKSITIRPSEQFNKNLITLMKALGVSKSEAITRAVELAAFYVVHAEGMQINGKLSPRKVVKNIESQLGANVYIVIKTDLFTAGDSVEKVFSLESDAVAYAEKLSEGSPSPASYSVIPQLSI